MLAAAGLALAVTSVGTVARAAWMAREAAQRLRDMKGDLGQHVRDTGALTSLSIALITAAVALLLCTLARHDLQTRPRLYPGSTASSTRSLVWAARLLAIPALVLGALMAIAYPITNSIW